MTAEFKPSSQCLEPNVWKVERSTESRRRRLLLLPLLASATGSHLRAQKLGHFRVKGWRGDLSS